MAYNVLSLDGGGIRGIISVVVLERLSREPSIAGFLDRVGLLADGGVFAPNPSMCALAQTQDARTGENVPLADVRLLSIGTGEALQRVIVLRPTVPSFKRARAHWR